MERELWPRLYHLIMEVGQGFRLIGVSFQPHVVRELVQVIGLPPPRLPAFDREVHQVIAFGFVGHIVEVTQVADVSARRYAMTSLHAAQLAHGEHQLLGGLLHGEALFGPELTQQGS